MHLWTDRIELQPCHSDVVPLPRQALSAPCSSENRDDPGTNSVLSFMIGDKDRGWHASVKPAPCLICLASSCIGTPGRRRSRCNTAGGCRAACVEDSCKLRSNVRTNTTRWDDEMKDWRLTPLELRAQFSALPEITDMRDGMSSIRFEQRV